MLVLMPEIRFALEQVPENYLGSEKNELPPRHLRETSINAPSSHHKLTTLRHRNTTPTRHDHSHRDETEYCTSTPFTKSACTFSSALLYVHEVIDIPFSVRSCASTAGPNIASTCSLVMPFFKPAA